MVLLRPSSYETSWLYNRHPNVPNWTYGQSFWEVKVVRARCSAVNLKSKSASNEPSEQAEEVLSKYPEGPVADIDGDNEVGEEHDIFDLFEQGVGSDEEFDDEEEYSGSGDVSSESAVFALLEAAKKGSRKAKKKAKKKIAKLIEQELEELEDLVEDAQTNVDGEPTDYEGTGTGDESEFYDLLEARRRAKKKAKKRKKLYDLLEGGDGDIGDEEEEKDENEETEETNELIEALLEAKRRAKKKAKKKKKIMDIFEAVEDADLLESYLLEEEGDENTEKLEDPWNWTRTLRSYFKIEKSSKSC